MPAADRPSRNAIALVFVSVYLCWGATYAAMHVGVALLPANILAGTRMLIGAAIMLVFCTLRRKRIFYPRYVMARLMLLGVMLLFGGNIGLVWSEKYLPSGLAALIVAVVPLYVVIIESLLPGGDRLRRRGYIGLGLGFAALVALLWPSLRSVNGHPMQTRAIIAVLAGALSWASGSVLSRRMKLPVDPLVAAGCGDVCRRNGQYCCRHSLLAVAACCMESGQHRSGWLSGTLRFAARL
jgi:drug/metabolite transporter (DMT)-like permease